MAAFASAIDVLFADPSLATDALWRAGGTDPASAVRVIIRQPDEIANFGESRVIMSTVLFDVRRSDISLPAEGDTCEIDGTVFEIIAEPRADALRLIWTCEAKERL
jgi:hypothetical protein